MKLLKLKIKVMLIVFFNINGIDHIEFLPLGQTINQNIYQDILQRLMHLVQEKRTVEDRVMAVSP